MHFSLPKPDGYFRADPFVKALMTAVWPNFLKRETEQPVKTDPTNAPIVEALRL